MKIKFKYISLLILCAAVIGGGACSVVAQNERSEDKILVAGNQPLRQSEVDKVVEFYEWAFETRFSADEKERYQTYVVGAFHQDAVAGREGTNALIALLAQVRTKNAAEQTRVRNGFNSGFVKDLRAADDEASQMLLAIYERGQNGGNEVASNQTDSLNMEKPVSTRRSGSGSSKLVGAWFRSDGTGGATDGTGKTRYNSGTDTTFEFFADGTTRVLIKKETLSITQCQINETTELTGTYQTSGSQLSIDFSTGKTVGTNSCQSSGNFNKTLSASNLTQTFVVKNLDSVFRPDAPLILCLDGAADDKCFERLIK